MTSTSRWPCSLILALALAGLSSCATPQTNAPAGAACLRSTQCAPGLACAGGICTNDLSGLAEAGTLPPGDMGAVEDTGVADDLGEPIDMGPPPPPVDLGPPVDMGVPVDMGPPPPPDLGPPAPDLGPPDLGPPEPDLGPPDLGPPADDLGVDDLG